MITRSKRQQTSKQATCLVESSFKAVPIWSLSDDLLSKIFAYLNPNDRFRLAEVCTRWAGVTRMDWTDVTCLDLSSIPAENIGPIVRLCPKLLSITAHDCELNVSSITANLRGELRSLSLFRVSATADTGLVASNRLCEAVFSELQSLPRLEELLLSHLRIGTTEFRGQAVTFQLPASLKRLQLSGRAFCAQFSAIEAAAAPWNTLDCLLIDPLEIRWPKGCADRYIYVVGRHESDCLRKMAALFSLRQLRELCILPFQGSWFLRADAALWNELSRLEVLCIDMGYVGACITTTVPARVSHLVPLFTSQHPSLRIIIITGDVDHLRAKEEALIPPRRRYPNGFGSDPLPLLHVFIGGQITQKLRFATPLDAMEVHPINLPMPQFLEQPEIAAIFKGSWIAEMIKKSAKANTPLWDYDACIAETFLVL